MYFLADHDVFGATIAFLRSQGHNVLTAREAGLARSPDNEVLRQARQTGRILLTRDSDYGSLTFLDAQPSLGIILLRISLPVIPHVHEELLRLLSEHSEEELHMLFAVVEPGRHRLRPLR